MLPLPTENHHPTNTKLSIGVVLYQNSERQVIQFLDSIRNAARNIPEIELRVIDNANDLDRARFENLIHEILGKRSKLAWHDSVGNIGFGKAHNFLMDSAFGENSDAYLCANPDGFFHPQSIDRLIVQHELCGGSNLLEMRQIPGEHPKPYNPVTLNTDWCSGAALLIPKAVYRNVGGFDENIFMYCEDVDLSWRARLGEHDCQIVPDAYFYHDVSTRQVSKARETQMFLSARYLGWKWKHPDFQNQIENLMLERQMISSRKKLQDLTQFPQAQPGLRAINSVVNFESMLHFSKARWNLDDS